MTKSIIGPNAAIRYLKAYNAHVDYWHQVNPAYALAYVDKIGHIPYIREYADAFPDTMIVARIKHPLDGGFHTKPTGKDDNHYYVASPGDYYRDFGDLGKIDNVILNVMNEPAGDADDDTINRLARWMVEYIGLAARDKSKAVLFNWADKNPKIVAGMMDNRFDIVLQLMSNHPDLFYMGMHFYGPDDITATIESYVTRCERIGIVPPKVIGSEFGIDSTGGKERGYKTHGFSGGTYAAWQISQVQHDLSPYIKRGVLVGLTCFQEGNSGGWDDFDIENDAAYKAEIKRAALAGELDPMPTKPLAPDYAPSTFTAGDKYTLQSADGARTNVRTAPIVSADNLMPPALDDKTVVKLLEVQQVGVDWWYRISSDTVQSGWLSGRGGRVTFTPVPVAVTPQPPVVPPPVIALPPPAVASTVYLMTSEQRTKLYTMINQENERRVAWLLELTNLVIGLQETTVTGEQKAA